MNRTAITGLLGVIATAKRAGLIDVAKPVLNELIQTARFWIVRILRTPKDGEIRQLALAVTEHRQSPRAVYPSGIQYPIYCFGERVSDHACVRQGCLDNTWIAGPARTYEIPRAPRRRAARTSSGESPITKQSATVS